MNTPFETLTTGGTLPRHLGLLSAAGLLCSLPAVAQASPNATVADCLRPPQAVATAAAPALVPPGSRSPQRLAQAQPTAGPARASAIESSSTSRGSSALLAQAGAPVPESLPACTYDPPTPGVIRGLW
jgi:hypothetical protein